MCWSRFWGLGWTYGEVIVNSGIGSHTPCFSLDSDSGLDPSIHRHNVIWEAADEAVLNNVHKIRLLSKEATFKGGNSLRRTKMKNIIVLFLFHCTLSCKVITVSIKIRLPKLKGTIRPDWISMRVVPLNRPFKEFQHPAKQTENWAALWRIFSSNKSAQANRKTGCYANCDQNKQEVGFIFVWSSSELWSLFKYSRVKFKNQKPIPVDVLFKAYPMDPIWPDDTF